MDSPPLTRAKRCALSGLLLIASLSPAAARSPKKPYGDVDTPYWRRNLFKRIAYDQKYFVVEWLPSEFRRPSFAAPLFGGTAAALWWSRDGAGTNWDIRIQSAIYRHTGPAGTEAAHVLTSIGNGAELAVFLGFSYLGGHLAHDDRYAAASSLAAESLATAGIWVVALKTVAARVRPGNPDQSEFFKYHDANNGSFPSGHAIAAFSVATVYAEQYRDKRWVPPLAYTMASLIGLSRLSLGQHFPTDVLVGGLLGNTIGRMVVARQAEDAGMPPRRAMRWAQGVQPIYDPSHGGYGIGWGKTW